MSPAPVPGTRRAALLTAATLGVVACGHTDVADTGTEGPQGPRVVTEPLRLTYNPRGDGFAVFADASTLWYAFDQSTNSEGDVCLGLLPAGGGSRRAERCDGSPTDGIRTDETTLPTLLSGDSLAWFYARRTVGTRFNQFAEVRVGRPATREPGRGVRSFPTATSAGVSHVVPGALAPLGDGRIAYLGLQDFAYRRDGADVLERAGRDIAILDPAAPTVPTTPVPGTDYASGVSAGPGPGELVFTVAGDGRVLRRDAAGTVTVLHDFGALVARDARAAGRRLVAVIGGNVRVDVTADGDRVQVDGGGIPVVVDLDTGEELRFETPDDRLFRRPALSPDGRWLVVESADDADLYRWELP